MTNNTHYSRLKNLYAEVGLKTWESYDFVESNLEVSRSFYTKDSLQLRKPVPKNLEVYALLSGLPFNKKIIEGLTSVQDRISKVLGDSLHYWVKPDNFGVEYCVFKWPDDAFDLEKLDLIKNKLAKVNANSFNFYIHGVQVNPDGCVVAKGYDENRTIFTIRNNLKDTLNFMPIRQSSWAHVPMGRILEPVGKNKFIQLKKLIEDLDKNFTISDKITTCRLVHETQWYMEKKNILDEYPFRK